MTERYALYFTFSQTDPLYRLASTWLDFDAYSNGTGDFHLAALNTLKSNYQQCTSTPAKYGFHATLKPPFRLQKGKSRTQLIQSIEEFSSNTASFECSPLTLKTLGNFLALVPQKHCVKLDALASQCIQLFDPFRAELNDQEYLNRKPEQLTDSQLNYLQQWGYPYVFDEFRFHMTLTNSLPEKKLKEIQEKLQPIFSRYLGRPLVVDKIHLYEQQEPNRNFQIVSTNHLM